MENSGLKTRVLTEIEKLISKSCSKSKMSPKFQKLHVAILKKYYNAADVSIDYHRKRVIMDIVMDDSCYDPKKVNSSLPILRANLLFKNLKEFLSSSLDKDNVSIAFYARLIRAYENRNVTLTVV
ncbi:hypothetical protein SAMN03080594_101135 [Arenibacter palladensis]|jgi:hypothetical protein|uniref:Uncharacterized protein n=1 Tax=Arenibacter palladensis TaxID=237373 RepID=A0A1M4T403_9FLAO|nr:hypothetical protein [Arenibacter palladensis]MDO6604001.1 hypothetical protein [Arenibacter palladensis]SHE39144.1 hypothetical protein SAMN03080594_101135 [Arenibacter palladensis]|tara:strand:+ start:2717 stop:3091 length:375 start_codon:yes stop_codon:yes gene_type:complete